MDSETATAHAGGRQHCYRMLSVLVSIAALATGIVILLHRITWSEIAAVWLRLDPIWLSAATGVYWLQYPVNSARFHLVVRWIRGTAERTAIPFHLVLRLVCGSGFVATVLPFGLAGDAARILSLRLVGGLSTLDSTRATIFDRALGAQWMSVVGLATLPVQALIAVPTELMLIEALLFGLVLGGAVVLAFVPSRLAGGGMPRLRKLASAFADYDRMQLPQRCWLQLALAILQIGVSCITVGMLLHAADLAPSLWKVACFIPFIQLVSSMPFLYLGWGGREAAMAATLGTVGGLSLDQAIAISSAWGAIAIVGGAVNGAFVLGSWRAP